MKVYIALFSDGTMMISNRPMEKSSYTQMTKFFEVDENVSLIQLSEWFGKNNKMECFKEI